MSGWQAWRSLRHYQRSGAGGRLAECANCQAEEATTPGLWGTPGMGVVLHPMVLSVSVYVIGFFFKFLLFDCIALPLNADNPCVTGINLTELGHIILLNILLLKYFTCLLTSD